MIYKIFYQDADTLLEKPETGMGYQIISAFQYERNQPKRFVVYNTNLAVEMDTNFQINKNRVFREGYKVILNKASVIMLETQTIKVLNKAILGEQKTLSYAKDIFYNRNKGGQGAVDNPKESANGNEIFVRISAFEDDRRIDVENNKLKPGSFTTTQNDYQECISTKDDPIDRYALPNEDEIKWAFYIQPKTVDILQRGIVQPAFNHEGGGMEAYFEDGTSKGTYLYKKKYGE